MKIYRVTSLTLSKSGNHLLIQAAGQVSSSGWTHPRLVLNDPNPADKVLEIDFEADPPGGISLPVILPTFASITVEAGDAEAVLVHARTNEATAHISETRPLIPAGEDRTERAREPEALSLIHI